MRMLKTKKAGFVFHIGGPVLLLTLVVIFIFIALSNPVLADKITGTVASIFGAVKGTPP